MNAVQNATQEIMLRTCYTIWFLIPDFSLLICRLVNLGFQTIYKLQTKAPLSVPLEHLFAKPTEMAIFPKMMLQTIDSLINLSFFSTFLRYVYLHDKKRNTI